MVHKPIGGLEPSTCWLQISCSANWAISAYSLHLSIVQFDLNPLHSLRSQASFFTRLSELHQVFNATKSAYCKKWNLQGSNLWPSACKADALPAELRFHIGSNIYRELVSFLYMITHKRPGWDSNPRPPPWQGGALTNWATRPYIHCLSKYIIIFKYTIYRGIYLQNSIQRALPSLPHISA